MERGSKWPKKKNLNRVLPPRFRTFLVLNSHVGVWILLRMQLVVQLATVEVLAAPEQKGVEMTKKISLKSGSPA